METEKKTLGFFYATGYREKPSERSAPLTMGKGNNKVNEIKYLLNWMAL